MFFSNRLKGQSIASQVRSASALYDFNFFNYIITFNWIFFLLFFFQILNNLALHKSPNEIWRGNKNIFQIVIIYCTGLQFYMFFIYFNYRLIMVDVWLACRRLVLKMKWQMLMFIYIYIYKRRLVNWDHGIMPRF